MDAVAEITRLWELAPAGVLVATRIGALFFSAPVVGGPFVPTRAKALLTLAVTVIVLPIIRPTLPTPLPLDFGYALLVAEETAVGLAIGFALTLLFEGIHAGGELINRFSGFSAAENFDPDAGIGEGPVGDMLMVGMVVLFLASDMHHFALATMARSFEAVPIGAWSMEPRLLQIAAQGTGDCMVAACSISLPVLAVVLLVTVAEGVISRAVPQVNIMFLSFAIKIWVSLVVLWAGMPAVVAFMGVCLAGSQRLVEATLSAMR